jgi:hypothetical protein
MFVGFERAIDDIYTRKEKEKISSEGFNIGSENNLPLGKATERKNTGCEQKQYLEAKRIRLRDINKIYKIHLDETLKEIRATFGVNDVTILYNIMQHGIIYKKLFYIGKEMNKSVKNSRNFLDKSK